MNMHMKGFNMSKIKHMRKNQGFYEIKLNYSASRTACLYDTSIFRILYNQYLINFYKINLIIFSYF